MMNKKSSRKNVMLSNDLQIFIASLNLASREVFRSRKLVPYEFLVGT